MNETLFAVLAAARWAQFTSLFILFGVLLFPFYAASRPEIPCGERLASSSLSAIAICGIIQALSILVWVATSIASMGDGWSSLGDLGFVKAFFVETSFGRLWLVRLVMTASLAGVLVSAGKRLTAGNASTGGALVLAGALLASQAGIGHAASLPEGERATVLAGYALHLLGAAAWIGGLWPLRALLAEARRDERIRPYVHFALGRFATMAAIAVALVLVGAAINIRPQLSSFDLHAISNLQAISTWGWAVGCKIALFGALIAIAYRNRFVLTPLFAQRPIETSGGLLRNVVADQGLALIVLAAAAVMGMTSPSG